MKTGTSHFELCSTDHVWAIIATPIKGGKSQASVAASKFSSNESLSHASATSSIFESPPTLLIIKPSIASLREGKCASMLWSPWCSLSVTQTMYSQGGQRIDSHNPGVTRIQPGIHIQLFDSTKKEFIHDAQEANAVDVNLGKLSRRPLRKSRDVYRRKKTS